LQFDLTDARIRWFNDVNAKNDEQMKVKNSLAYKSNDIISPIKLKMFQILCQKVLITILDCKTSKFLAFTATTNILFWLIKVISIQNSHQLFHILTFLRWCPSLLQFNHRLINTAICNMYLINALLDIMQSNGSKLVGGSFLNRT
jgi:hypothetical protein